MKLSAATRWHYSIPPEGVLTALSITGSITWLLFTWLVDEAVFGDEGRHPCLECDLLLKIFRRHPQQISKQDDGDQSGYETLSQ